MFLALSTPYFKRVTLFLLSLLPNEEIGQVIQVDLLLWFEVVIGITFYSNTDESKLKFIYRSLELCIL